MKSPFNTIDPERVKLSARISVQIRAFERRGGKIQQIPFGVCSENALMSLREYNDLCFERSQRNECG